MVAPPVTIVALPPVVNLTLAAGDDFYMDLVVTGVDLTGAQVQADIRASHSGWPLAVFEATVEANTIHLHLPSGQAAQVAGPASWGCRMANPDVITLVAGRVTVGR